MNRKLQDFDKFVENYRDIHTKNICTITGTDSDYFSKYKFEEISKRVKNASTNLKILDFGCGDGIGAVYAKMFLHNATYFGIDISKESIELAKYKNRNHIEASHFIFYDGKKIPFADNTFDIVFVSCVFHHIDSEKHIDVLKELNRVLMIGGEIVFV